MGRIELQYAKALYNTAKNLEILDKIYNDIKQPAWNRIFSKKNIGIIKEASFIKKKEIVNIVTQILKNKVDTLIIKCIELLGENGRFEVVQKVFEKFIEIYCEKKKIIVIKISAPTHLSAENLEKVKNKVIKIIEKENYKYEYIISVNKSLVGGYTIEYGTYFYDASLRNSLKILKNSLN